MCEHFTEYHVCLVTVAPKLCFFPPLLQTSDRKASLRKVPGKIIKNLKNWMDFV